MAASAGVSSVGVAESVYVGDATKHYQIPTRPNSRTHRRARAIIRATIGRKFPAGGRAAIAGLP